MTAKPKKATPAKKNSKPAAKKAVAASGGDLKETQLRAHRIDKQDTVLTTDQGIVVDDTDNALRAGPRGPNLLEDFHLREKIMRFDHERIPERVVHARGSGAHGFFQPYGNELAAYTKADFLIDPSVQTPVFVRFSTVQGSRGSTDTPRDVRGFAVKFYTQQGNFDLVGNNMPVFFIQDGIKFPDIIHAVKPEPHHEMPQAASAHDSFWDFVTQQPETMHHVIWLMSDRAIPRSFRTMQGFGVHTFRLVDGGGKSTFVKFHWKPVAGTHSLVWDEAQKISGKDPDFNRRDLWESIESGAYPEYELGVQLIAEEDEFAFDGIDLLDATKLIPEELVPVTPVGRMVLNRNPDNFFAETEQIAFSVGNVVPGIDFTNDPLMQARLFSYLDTQLTRLGGPNFAQIPINQPVAPVRHHQQDGFHQHAIPLGEGNYHPNTTGGGCPFIAGADNAFKHFPQEVDGVKLRKRAETFADHYSQATLFWNSMSAWEKEHIVAAYRFELGKVTRMPIRELMVEHLARIDHSLAVSVAAGVGVAAPAKAVKNHGRFSAALSQDQQPPGPITGRKVAVLVADGVEATGVKAIQEGLAAQGAVVELLGLVDGIVKAASGKTLPVDRAMNTVSSVLYDAVVVAGGTESADALADDGYAVHFIAETYKHAKPLAILGEGEQVVRQARLPIFEASDRPGKKASKPMAGALDGVVAVKAGQKVTKAVVEQFAEAIAAHRHFDRPVNGIAA
ncbi:catalase [Catelliglobosispora koreensis]|uniref:catalase n=1 Tax=Catelliglobosispora koreensis TaxID=129052 RepID=UPI000380951D|nr:catalase [Catelliglobosispora koreensis]